MRNRAEIAGVGLRRKNFMRRVRQQIEHAAVGVVNENKFRRLVCHLNNLIFAQFFALAFTRSEISSMLILSFGFDDDLNRKLSVS